MYYLQLSMWQHSQYNYHNIHWNIWGSNLGRNKRSISSPKHPDQLQCPPSIQLNENQSYFSGSTVTSADSLITHICLGRSLKFSAAIHPLNLSVSMEHIGINWFYLNLLPMYISLNRSHLSSLIKEPFYTSLTCHMHTAWTIYFIFIDPITLTLWTVPITKLIT